MTLTPPGTYPANGTPSGLYAPTLSGFTDWSPTPRVQILFNSLDPNAATVTVWRQATGRQMPVRGGINLPVAGGAGLVDLEAPSGVTLLYLAQQFDADGSFISNTGTGTITLSSPDTVIQNPFNPAGAVKVRVGVDTGAKVQLGSTLTAVYPAGRRAGIGIGGQRFGIPNVPVYVYGATADDAAALDAMLGTVNGNLGLPPFMVVRFAAAIAARIGLPQPLVVGQVNPTRTLINVVGGGQVTGWDLSGPELDPPAAALAAAVYSRDDMDAVYASRDARDAAYLSRLAMDTDYRYSGAANGPDDTGDGSTDESYGYGDYGVGDYGGPAVTGTPTPAVDNGDGTTTVTAVDNGDGTATIT